ncbi:MAG: polysaccharide pyruvyl transferase family protein [Myxococcaceae bacterium]|nr:polysaccharide pyruvyl transferase family protein [Myxococcaceae bacterium]
MNTFNARRPCLRKRIGILTFHRALNYGAILQTYALQQAIARLSPDIDVRVVDYFCPAIERPAIPRRVHWRRGAAFGLSRYLFQVLNSPAYLAKKRPFKLFCQRHLSLTRRVNAADIASIVDEFDYFVSGSDQVWNRDMTGGDGVYFLDFAPENMRVAYAPSFGGARINRDDEDWYRAQLQGWARLSAREERGASFVRKLTGKQVPVVLDPTFLLSADEWLRISEAPFRIRKNKYILIYKNRASPNMIRLARKLAARHGWLVRWVAPDLRQMGREFFLPQSPSEFIGLMRGAEFVLTNSFHGTAFSIILQKPFLSEVVDGHGAVNARVDNILTLLGLQERGRMDAAMLERDMDSCAIDWNAVEKRLQAARAQSMAYLRDSFRG